MQPASRLSHPSQRLERLSLWLCLALARFMIHALSHVAPRVARQTLRHFAHAARLVLVARALRTTKLAKPRGADPTARKRRLTCRGVAGAQIRRALRANTPEARARAIADMLAAPERWIGLIARRLRKGFTKMRRLPRPKRQHTPCVTQITPSPCAAPNSS